MANQKWPEKLYVVRHGQSERNVMKDAAKLKGTAPTWSDGVRDQDTPLTPYGVLQALSVGVALREKHPEQGVPPEGPVEVLYVSPYLRARMTAEEIVKGLGYYPKVVIEERIREIEFGILDGLSA